MAFDALPPLVRRVILLVWATAFVALLFFIGPGAMRDLNQDWGWPRWQTSAGRAVGVVLILGGVTTALYCSRLFTRVGKGTPIPADPPKHLVISGLYRYSRNPIYVADVAILLGIFLYFGELALLLYAGIGALILQAVIVWWEEPVLKKRFGDAYIRYVGTVPRWLVMR